METLTMSREERKRLVLLVSPKSKKLSRVQASELMGDMLSAEQADLEEVSGN